MHLNTILQQLPLYDDQGRLLAVHGQRLPRPADHTDQTLSNIQAQLGRFQPVPTIQTNNMDEAYNHTLKVAPMQYASPSAQMIAHDQQNHSLQQILIKLFGGR